MTPPEAIARRLSALLDAMRSRNAPMRAEVSIAIDLAGLTYAAQPLRDWPAPNRWRAEWTDLARDISRMLADDEAHATTEAAEQIAHARERRWSHHVSVVGLLFDARRAA